MTGRTKEQTGLLGRISSAVFLVGAIIFVIGIYYYMIKAGIPYQDPPIELQIQYAVNLEVGELLLKTGARLSCLGCVIWLVLKVIAGKKNQDDLIL